MVVSEWVSGLGIWPLVVILALNLYFRRFGRAGQRKRMASLFQAMAIFIITSLATLIMERGFTDTTFWAGSGLIILVMLIFRQRVFPYRLRCIICGNILGLREIYFLDSNCCPNCNADLE